MLTYVTETEYRELLGEESIPSNFNNLNIEASTYINHKTFGRIDVNDIPEEVKYVTCLIINLINEKDTKSKNIGNLKSENIEGWSVSYQTADELELEYSERMYETLKDYLWNVKGSDGNLLLYGGVWLYE